MITSPAVLARVNAYVALVQAHYNSKSSARDTTFVFENTGNKYNRIVQVNNQRSVHAFVDNDGLLYKAAGWKAPVNGARWDLMDPANFEALAKVIRWSGTHLYVMKDVGQLPKGYTVDDRPTTFDQVVESLNIVPEQETIDFTPADARDANRGYAQALKDPAASFAADFPELFAAPTVRRPVKAKSRKVV